MAGLSMKVPIVGRTMELKLVCLIVLFALGSVFFFQAEDGIRDYKVTGVQTCALPICPCTSTTWGGSADRSRPRSRAPPGTRDCHRGLAPDCVDRSDRSGGHGVRAPREIGRASCRERV